MMGKIVDAPCLCLGLKDRANRQGLMGHFVALPIELRAVHSRQLGQGDAQLVLIVQQLCP